MSKSLKNQVYGQVGDKASPKPCWGVDYQVLNKVWDSVRLKVMNQVLNQVDNQVYNQVLNQVFVISLEDHE